MNRQKLIMCIAVLLLAGSLPLAAQNAPAGGLVSGSIINRDIDTYMMVNFSPFLNYDKFFTFMQANYTQVHWPAPMSYLPGIQAGFATKLRGNFLNLYMNTTGYSQDIAHEKTELGADTFESTEKSKRFNMQFDTAFGNVDLGAFKLGLNFIDIGNDRSESDDLTKIKKNGTFTPSIAYGQNIINNDYSMLLLSGTARVRLPMDFGRTITEDTVGGITTTTKTTGASNLLYPGLYPTSHVRMEIEPQMWYFFKPQLEPMVVISHIYLLNTFVMHFYPEELSTTHTPGLSDGYIKQERKYIGDTLFGYYNVLYVINSRLSLAWRVNFSAGFFRNEEGFKYSKAPGGTETVDQVSGEVWFLTATIAPRLSFGYQLIPAKLTLNGALALNYIGPTNAIGWQQYRTTITNEGEGTIKTDVQNLFNPVKPFFTLGASWSLSPFLALESGITINTSKEDNFLDNILVGVVYKR